MESVIKYMGGKNLIANWILSFFPKHTCYVETHGGSAAVLLNKLPSTIEVYNDLNDDAVNFFRVLRSGMAENLAHLVDATPVSLREYKLALQAVPDGDETSLEKARRFLIRSFMSFSPDGVFRPNTGFRRDKAPGGGTVPEKWNSLPGSILLAARRMKHCTIECLDALEVLKHYDRPDTLFYVDPPYLRGPRSGSGFYTHDYTIEDHRCLLDAVLHVQGKVVLSGYDHPLYHHALSGWNRVSKKTRTMRHTERTEQLWMNFTPYPTLF